jgi:hypothetical protein
MRANGGVNAGAVLPRDRARPEARQLDNALDGAGSRERVVGYGAWVFEEPGGERRPAGMPDDQARG